jgi:hypothetical protein
MRKFEDVERGVKRALDNFLVSESYLLEYDVNERSITHKFAEHLKFEFLDLDVDCEYNKRNKGGNIVPKRLVQGIENVRSDNEHGKTVYPDIIIHNRKNIENNLLIIEAKKESNPEAKNNKDEEKIKAYLEEYHYKFGLFIEFYVKTNYQKHPTCQWYFPEAH